MGHGLGRLNSSRPFDLALCNGVIQKALNLSVNRLVIAFKRQDIIRVGFDDFLIAEMQQLVRSKESVKEAIRRRGDDWRWNAEYRERD